MIAKINGHEYPIQNAISFWESIVEQTLDGIKPHSRYTIEFDIDANKEILAHFDENFEVDINGIQFKAKIASMYTTCITFQSLEKFSDEGLKELFMGWKT